MNEHDAVSVFQWNSESWDQLAGAVAALEAAWNERGAPPHNGSQLGCVSSELSGLDGESSPIPELSRFVPALGDSRREGILVELIKVDQEYRWQAGQPCPLEIYLQQWPELNGKPKVIAALLTAECLTRTAFGDNPSPDELQTRFPHVADSIPWEAIRSQVCAEQRSSAESLFSGIPNASETTGGKSIQPGDHIGRFEIRRVIGHGAMGVVYQAFDPRLERDIALKIPHIGTVDHEVTERFLQEARAAAAIDHPHLCTVHDSGEADGLPYLVMPLIQGLPLLEWLRDKSPPPRQSAEVVLKLAKALDALHAAGIVHQDIKPQNIIIVGQGDPLLMDFGLAWKADPESKTQPADNMVGTPAYMSPEQVTGAVSEIDRRSDIYSLGVLTYQMLTGRLPFAGTLTQVLAQIPHGNAPPPRSLQPDIDPELEQICQQAMAARPADRFQTGADMAAALQSYLQQANSRTSVVIQTETAPRRQRIVWTMVGGIAVLAVGVMVLVDSSARRNPRAPSVSPAPPVSVPPEPIAQTDPFLETAHREIAAGLPADPDKPRVRELRMGLLRVLREHPGTPFAHEAVRLLVQLPWPVGSTDKDPNVWMKTVPKPDNPTDGGTLLERCELPVGANVVIRGHVEYIPSDRSHGHDSFRIWFPERKLVVAHLISLTPGNEVFLIENWPTPDERHGDSNSEGTVDGRNFHRLPAPMAAPENFIRFHIQTTPEGRQSVDYLLHVWQTEP